MLITLVGSAYFTAKQQQAHHAFLIKPAKGVTEPVPVRSRLNLTYRLTAPATSTRCAAGAAVIGENVISVVQSVLFVESSM